MATLTPSFLFQFHQLLPPLFLYRWGGLHVATKQNLKMFLIELIDILSIKLLCNSNIKISFNNKNTVLSALKTNLLLYNRYKILNKSMEQS